VEYETPEMDIVIVRKLRSEFTSDASPKNPFGELVDLSAPSKSKESKMGYNAFDTERRNLESSGGGAPSGRNPVPAPFLGNMGPTGQPIHGQPIHGQPPSAKPAFVSA
jgi:hypothetical protein